MLPNPIILTLFLLSFSNARVPENLIPIDRLRYDFLDLEETLWRYVLDYVDNNVKEGEIDVNGPEVELIRRFEEFGNKIQAVYPYDLDSGLDHLESVWPLQLALADLRPVYAQYETFRRFQRQQTAPGRIPAPKRAWTDFAEAVLQDPQDYSMDEAMERVNAIVVSGGLFQGVRQEVEGDMICDTKQSPQQVLYNLYSTITLTELKGYSMIQFSYMLLRLYGEGNFTTEAKTMRKRYEERANTAIEIVKQSMRNASRQLWNCDPKKHIKGETYEEVTQLLQGYVQNEVDLNPEGTCRENCAEYTYTKSHGCYKNLFCQQQRRCNGKIINCHFYDADMWICPADPSSGRRYEYIEYENGRVLGRKQACTRGTTKVDSWWRWLFWHCSYCFCYCDEQGPNSDRYFNMRPVLANVENNSVVTGLRFVKHNRIIHIQIQEGKLQPRGNIDPETIKWKPVEDYKITDKNIQSGKDYHTMSWEKRAFDLDDLEGDEGYILTGVRFKEIGSHLNFEIYLTKFDFEKGKLIPQSSIWKDNPNTDSSIKNPSLRGYSNPVRLTKVRLNRPDIPTRSTSPSVPDSSTDQYIEFTNTDIDKDVAQTTVPFLDAQKVESFRPVPLSGAGVFHKGRDHFGGFVAPKLITYDFSKHLKAAFPEEQVN
ncbi:unnamed protein product [Callosobruchus maculatus]|uniref:Uncharacterized protein n=1 Tax=Callosobruchus maculatus TaxID=64391 RepID=A0A653BLV1_CALMS|nr:unnamed protein product [Callosobruchus maculatus]